MAVDGYMYFKDYNDTFMSSESTVDTSNNSETLFSEMGFSDAVSPKGLFEIEDFSFDIEQTLNIGSGSTGSGSGKVTFNAFSINRKIDKSSTKLFEMACSGTPFKQVGLGLRKAGGGATAGRIYLVFLFKLVAVKTISWSYDDESPKEAITFGYGGLQIRYCPQKSDGSLDTPIPGGWNAVTNVKDQALTPITF